MTTAQSATDIRLHLELLETERAAALQTVLRHDVAYMQEQVDEGSLVIRKMTDEERARFESARRDRPQSANAKRRGRPSRKRAVPPLRKS